jgi:hypothetical protein
MKVLFGSYRLDQYSDPEMFKVNIGMVLEQYPIDTVRFVTDPRTGIQRRCNWPPTVKEVVDACDQHIQASARTARYRNWGKRNAIEGPKPVKPTLEELKAKYGPNWGIGFQDRPGAGDWIDEAAKRLREKHPKAFETLRQD